MMGLLQLAAAVALSGNPEILERTQAVNYAAGHHPTVLAALARLDAARTHLVQARALPNPNFQFQVTGFNPANQSTQGLQAMLTQTIELSGRRRLRYASESQGVLRAELGVTIARRAAAAEVKKAYHQVLSSRAALSVAEGSAKWAEQLLDVAGRRVRLGEAPPVEALRAQSALSQARQDLLSARNDIEAALQRLQVAVGAGHRIEVPAHATPRKANVTLPTRETLINLALSNRAELAQAQSAVEQEHANESVLRANIFPSADVSLGANPNAGVPGIAAGVQVPVPVWYALQGEIAESQALQQALKYDSMATEQAVRAQVEQTASRVNVAQSQIQLYESQLVPAAMRLQEMTRRRYQEGDATGFELLEVRRAYRETLLAELRARLDFQDALVDLETAIGEDLQLP